MGTNTSHFRSAAAAFTRAVHSFTQKVGDVITASHLPASAAAAGARSRARSDAELAASRIRPRSRVPPWVQRLQESYHMHATVMSPRSVSVLTAQAHFGSLFPIIIVGLLILCCGAGLLGLMKRKRQQEEAEAEERRRRSAAAWATAPPGAAGIQMPPMAGEPAWDSTRPQPNQASGWRPPYDPRFSQQMMPPQAQGGGPAYGPYASSAPYAAAGYPPPPPYPYTTAAGYPPPPTAAGAPAAPAGSRFGGLGGMAASGLGGLALGGLLGHGLGRGGLGGWGGGGYDGGGGFGGAGYGGDGGGGGEFAAEEGPSMVRARKQRRRRSLIEARSTDESLIQLSV